METDICVRLAETKDGRKDFGSGCPLNSLRMSGCVFTFKFDSILLCKFSFFLSDSWPSEISLIPGMITIFLIVKWIHERPIEQRAFPKCKTKAEAQGGRKQEQMMMRSFFQPPNDFNLARCTQPNAITPQPTELFCWAIKRIVVQSFSHFHAIISSDYRRRFLSDVLLLFRWILEDSFFIFWGFS